MRLSRDGTNLIEQLDVSIVQVLSEYQKIIKLLDSNEVHNFEIIQYRVKRVKYLLHFEQNLISELDSKYNLFVEKYYVAI